MMAVRAKTLSAGYSGVRPELIDALVAFINAGLIPPSRSTALWERAETSRPCPRRPLSHWGRRLLERGEPVETGEALERAGIRPFRLATKEGLALINGTDGMLAMLLLSLEDLKVLRKTADVTAAMSVEALLGTDRVFREDLHSVRPHPGQLR